MARRRRERSNDIAMVDGVERRELRGMYSLCFEIAGRVVMFPKSQIYRRMAVAHTEDVERIYIPVWLARKKGLEYR